MAQNPNVVLSIPTPTNTVLNLTAATVIKAIPGRIFKILVVSGGTTGGSFVLNDCATVGAAAAANQILIIPQGTNAGTIYSIDWTTKVGLVLSAVPTGGSPQLSISYT